MSNIKCRVRGCHKQWDRVRQGYYFCELHALAWDALASRSEEICKQFLAGKGATNA